jgi:hypothetical protein
MMLIKLADPPEWQVIRSKWDTIREAKGYAVTFMGQRFGGGRPFTRRKDAEVQADTNARNEMRDVLQGRPQYTLEDFGL